VTDDTAAPAVTDIEQCAAAFLARIPGYIWDGESLPIPVEDIADSHLGLLVREVGNLATAPGAPVLDDGQSLSGLLLPSRGEIWVSADEARDWPTRRRFTIAHELGHWCLHREVERSLFCRAATIEARDQDEPSAFPALEHEANVFAAAVLMPARLVRERYKSSGRDFEQLRELFAVSGAAMGRRLHAIIPPHQKD
jgi:hypothetical protein